MGPLSLEERRIVDALDRAGLDFALIQLTQTGLTKSTLDATKEVRLFLTRQNLHDYSAQGQGIEHRSYLPATIVLIDGSHVETRVSLNRPRSGNGDPRIWIRDLAKHCNPGDKIALVRVREKLLVLNISDRFGGHVDLGVQPTGGHESALLKDRWDYISMLWERANGGRDVAAVPDDIGEGWPSVRGAAGVTEALDWLRAATRDRSVARLLFLVGGPGAGKSHASATLVDGLAPIDELTTELAHRTYRYEWGDRELVLVNDATITSDEHEVAPLAAEINDSIQHGKVFLGCVNRGVLVEEASAARRLPSSIGSAVVTWLQDATPREILREKLVTTIDGQAGYFRTGLVRVDGVTRAEIAVVSVDACSLLERTPDVSVLEHDEDVVIEPQPYGIVRFSERATLNPAETSAGELFQTVASRLEKLVPWTAPDGYLDPFRANVESVTRPAVRNGILNLARAAEIVTGTTFTFRDLWGLIVRSLVGAAPNEGTSTVARERIHSLQPTSPDPVQRFGEAQLTAQYRFSQAIFGVGLDGPSVATDPRANPITRRLACVDPVVDMIPGLASDGSGGWATPVVDAFAGPIDSGSPLATLLESEPENGPLAQIVTSFDRTLDKLFVEATGAPRLSDPTRERLVAWYGRYLTRLYAIAHGITAFRKEVDAWTLAWLMAPSVPSGLEAQLRTLVRPPRQGWTNSVIPALDSRAEPIVGDMPVPKLGVIGGTFELRTYREGEELFFSVLEGIDESPRMRLDFPVIRQAQSCSEGWIGVTEAAESTAPRLERFRSAQLIRTSSSVSFEYVVVAGASQYKLKAGAT